MEVLLNSLLRKASILNFQLNMNLSVRLKIRKRRHLKECWETFQSTVRTPNSTCLKFKTHKILMKKETTITTTTIIIINSSILFINCNLIEF